MEMLSEHTLEGWLEGYVLTGRHGFFSTYEAFVHVIDSMFNQHAKWLDKCTELSWRAPDIASLNLLMTSTVWRQDHNGFTHQDPGFLDVVANKSPARDPHLPAAGRELPSFGGGSLPAEPQLRQCDRGGQAATPVLSRHGRGGEALRQGRWHLAAGEQRPGQPSPTSVMASCGDIATMEALAATAMLREHFPELKVRFVNVVDLFRAGAGHRASAWFLRP